MHGAGNAVQRVAILFAGCPTEVAGGFRPINRLPPDRHRPFIAKQLNNDRIRAPRIELPKGAPLAASTKDESSMTHWRNEIVAAAIAAGVGVPLSQGQATLMAYQQAHDLPMREAVAQILERGGWNRLYRGMVGRYIACTGTMFFVPNVSRYLMGDDGGH